MAGHSKWANIRHRKSASDARRNKVFTKLAKEIMVAAKIGGSDESANPRLKAAVSKARSANMPKDNIDRAIKRGSGELENIQYEEITYEAYAPGGIALIMEVMTDKKSRTLPEIKSILTKYGGNLGESGSVSYLFDYRGMIFLEGAGISEDALLETALEAGAEDLESEEGGLFAVKTLKENFHTVLWQIQEAAEKNRWTVVESGLQYIPQAHVPVSGTQREEVEKLIEALENHDDIQNVYSNMEAAED